VTEEITTFLQFSLSSNVFGHGWKLRARSDILSRCAEFAKRRHPLERSIRAINSWIDIITAPMTSEKGALSLIDSARASCYQRFVSVFFFLFFLENSEREHVSEEPGVKSKRSLSLLAIRLNASAFICWTTVRSSFPSEEEDAGNANRSRFSTLFSSNHSHCMAVVLWPVIRIKIFALCKISALCKIPALCKISTMRVKISVIHLQNPYALVSRARVPVTRFLSAPAIATRLGIFENFADSTCNGPWSCTINNRLCDTRTKEKWSFLPSLTSISRSLSSQSRRETVLSISLSLPSLLPCVVVRRHSHLTNLKYNLYHKVLVLRAIPHNVYVIY